MSMQVDEEDDSADPVVRTLDVFLSQNLPGTRDATGRSDGLFLFQHPLRPKYQPLEEGWTLDKVSYRPLNQVIFFFVCAPPLNATCHTLSHMRLHMEY